MSKIKEQLPEKQNETLPATQYENPWLEAAAEGGNELGKLPKFVKGEWTIGDDAVADNAEYVAHIDQAIRGWVKFDDGKVVERIIGKIADGFKPPRRENLPDNDPANWHEKDADGEPRDPWVAQWFLPLIGVATGDVVTFVTGSKGGISAVADLCRVYGNKQRDGLRPIVALRTRSYKHKQYGRIETPDLPIVGWDGVPTVVKEEAAAISVVPAQHTKKAAAKHGDMDDTIPF